tara:strand:- start:6 stop:209 length:204 start_codon:yes stop_codon:yes gene_type:complete
MLNQDFKVYEETNRKGQTIFRVKRTRLGVILQSFDEDYANKIANSLNLDPWFLDRNQTRADRIAAFK